MRTLGVVEVDVTPNAGLRFGDTVVGMQIYLLVLDAAPEALDEDIITPAPLAVHALQDAMGGKQRDKLTIGKLAALVGVENIGPTVPSDRFLHGLNAEIRREAVGEPPGEHLTAAPVHDHRQVHKASPHGKVADVHRPDLIG